MGERHALLIGVDFFQDEKLSRLLAPKGDVYALREALLNPGIGGFDTAEVLFNSDLVPIQTALHQLFDRRSPDDLLFLYYTGHGLIDRRGALYLSLHQTKAETPTIGSLEAGFVRERMRDSSAEAQIVVLDCCHSGAFMEGAKRAPGQQAVTGQTFETGGKGQYILSACTATEFAFEAGELKDGDPDARPRSVFTECLVKALTTGDAAPQDETVTIDALYHHTRSEVLERNMPMDPQRWISGGSGDLVIAQNPDIRIPVPEELRKELLSGTKLGRLGAVEALSRMLDDETNPFQADQASTILEEGLRQPEWVEVKEAIEQVLGHEESTRESVAVSKETSEIRKARVNNPKRDAETITAIKTLPAWKSASFYGGVGLGLVLCLGGVSVWWAFVYTSEPTILSALRTQNAGQRDKIAKLEQQLDRVNVANAEALRQAADVRDEIKDAESKTKELNDLKDQAIRRAGEAEGRADTAEEKAERLGKLIEEKDKQIEVLSGFQSENEKLKVQISDLELSLSQSQQSEEAGRIALAKLETEKTKLQNKQKNVQKSVQAEVIELRQQVEAAQALVQKDPEGRFTSWTISDDLPDLAVLREELSDGTFAPEMIVIPAGSFMMGSPQDELGRGDDEDDKRGEGGSQVKITFKNRFAIGRTEVTFADWDACVADGGCNDHSPKDEWGRGEHPVIRVSWDDAQSYVTWLNGKVGGNNLGPYRLPSEAEWEYAARATTTTPFWTGETISTDQANHDGTYVYRSGERGQYRGKTVEVASLNTPNDWGLHDVHGNVWEWVQDSYQDNLSGTPTDGSAHESAASYRVLRGGSWVEYPWYLRSAYRKANKNLRGNKYIGFRLSRTLSP